MDNLPSLISAGVNDFLTMCNIGGTNFTAACVQGILGAHIRKRAEEARIILIEEFRKARIDKIEWATEDEFAGTLLRYLNAVRDNAARLNLRLMAKVMVGQAVHDRLYADDFNRYANSLSTLSRKEVVALVNVHMLTVSYGATPADGFTDPRMEAMLARVVPSTFKSGDEFVAVCGAISRTGFIISSNDKNIFRFTTTALMDEICELADFKDALRSEDSNL